MRDGIFMVLLIIVYVVGRLVLVDVLVSVVMLLSVMVEVVFVVLLLGVCKVFSSCCSFWIVLCVEFLMFVRICVVWVGFCFRIS